MSQRPRDFHSFGYDGHAVLAETLKASVYGSLEQAVAALAVYAHPQTVAQTRGRNTFLVIRGESNGDRGKYSDDGSVMFDDNTAPTEAFVWPHRAMLANYRDVQFNHLWADSKTVSMYTNVANICLLPAFLSKLTDTDKHIRSLLQFRAFALFGFLPPGHLAPMKPDNYDALIWADPLSPVRDLEATYRSAMLTKPKNRTRRSARELGWLFSDFQPDATL
jgi:hypothetical protein